MKHSPRKHLFPISCSLLCLLLCLPSVRAEAITEEVQVVGAPDLSQTNGFYSGNRPPLEASRFLPLPTGDVQPRGWLLTILQRQRDGLSGHLSEISKWLAKKDNAWLSKDGKGTVGWEELPYWLRGYIELAYILKDPRMIAESKVWIEGAINSQRPNGDFGPDIYEHDQVRDFWANMLMLYCLETYYAQTKDPRVIELMTKYFKYHLSLPDNQLLGGFWQKMRGGDELYSIYWLYNRTGNPDLLKLADKIHRLTANWEMKNDLPSWHNVNIAQAFREPATYFLQTHQNHDLQATYDDFKEVRKRFGQVPGGMFGGDENCRPGYFDPHQAIETCGMVEQMLSDELLTQFTGDTFWADNCENVAFNSYPAALTADMRALRYLTAPNMTVADAKDHHPGVDDSGPFLLMNPFSSRCCQHNHAMGWPYYAKHLWLASPGNGLCASLYCASKVTAKVGNGTTVRIEEKTHYPFEEKICFSVKPEKEVSFPLYLRIPGWCDSASVFVNGSKEAVSPEAGKYLRINRTWKKGDTVTLTLPMKVAVKRWEENQDSVSVNYGPLTFSLKIGLKETSLDSTNTAIFDSGWQKSADPKQWPSTKIEPVTAWNYGLVLPETNAGEAFTVKRLAWPTNDYPFTSESAPIELTVDAKKIPGWKNDQNGLCGQLQQSPIASSEPLEKVTLIPMGATRLRITAFPTIADPPRGRTWIDLSIATATASHSDTEDPSVLILDAGDKEPVSSADHTAKRFTWWPHLGGTEWVQQNFAKTRKISSVEVYWFDDTGVGNCRVPKSWRLLAKNGDQWKPVPGTRGLPVDKDKATIVSFTPITTSGLRIEADLQPGSSGGILRWVIK